MTTSAAQVTSNSLGQGFASEIAPDHADIPFFKGPSLPMPNAAEELIAQCLDCEQVIDLAASKDSPLKDNAAIQKTAAVWHDKHPNKCNAQVENINKREAEAEAAAQKAARKATVRACGRVLTIASSIAWVLGPILLCCGVFGAGTLLLSLLFGFGLPILVVLSFLGGVMWSHGELK